MLLYAVEEVTAAAEVPEEPAPPATMAQFWGILSDEAAQDILQRSEEIRNEWDRKI